ncbi:telomerase-binding protein EST1A-like [Lytechinus pictus]|uniref:telomerase-binding protein EST1A-like n=1 Tax=Lytechinus pictus TaxID=7653 RepID=UPI0030B9B58C
MATTGKVKDKKVEVVKVTHDQLKRRVETLKKDASHERRDDPKEKASSQMGAAEKAEKHPTKSRSTKARREKEQRKPDQQLYRPGMSRIAKNSSSPGSDLNSSREESPTKPVQDPVNLSEIGSKGFQVCHVHEENQSKEPTPKEEATHVAEPEHSKNQGYERSGTENAQRGGRNGSRNDKFDRQAESGGSHAHSGSRPWDKQEPLHHRERGSRRPCREESSKVSRVGKAPSLHNEHADEDTWEIKPEDWEAETTCKSSGIKVNKGQSAPKHAQSRNRNQSHQQHVLGQNKNESPPKQVQSRNGKQRHSDDVRNKDRKQNADDDPNVSENTPQEIKSLMGSDWDKEFEQQYQAQHSPKKTDPRHKVTKQKETVEQLPQSRRASGKANARQDHGPRTSNKKGHSYSEVDSSQHEPKKDLVKSSRQNYASEIQKLRAKKEMMERENSSQEEFETASSAKDLQITVKTGSEVDDRLRVVQEKPAKSYSSGQSRQRIDSDISNSKRNEKTDKGPVLTMSGEWEEEVDDLNFHVESMVITNRKFQKKESDKPGRFERPFQDRTHPHRDERCQNEHYDDRERLSERPDIEGTRPPTRDERSQMKNRDEVGYGRLDNRRPQNRNDRFQNKDYSEKDFERPHNDRRRPPDRDERYQTEYHDDRALQTPDIKETRPSARDERSQMKNREAKGYGRSDNRRPSQRNDRFEDRDHSDRDYETPREDRRRLSDRGERQTMQHDSQTFHSGTSNNERKEQRNDRNRDKDEPYLSGNDSRYRNREESYRQGHNKQSVDLGRSGQSGSDRQHRNDEDSQRSGNGRHEDGRKAPDKRYDQDGGRHSGEPQRDHKDQDERKRYHSGGKKDTRRHHISVSSDDSSERHGRRRGSSEAEESGTKHGGGILRLPGKTEQEKLKPQGNYAPVYDQYYHPPEEHTDAPVLPDESKAKPKGRTGDQSRLWDPSKPNQKPALQQHQTKHGELHFQDPESDKGESRGEGTPPATLQENWNSYIPNFPPGFAGMVPPHYGYPPPPPGYSVPTSSWENQPEGAQTYKSGNPPLPPYMMQYPPPYGRHPNPLPPGMPYPGYQNPPHAAMIQEHLSVNRQSAQKLLRDAARCETDLFNALSHGISTREMLQQLQDKQQELEQLYEGIILLDLDLCNQYNVEQMLWKNCYYQIIEALRKAIQEQPNGDSYKEDLLDFMHHGTTFYEGVLNKLQSTYHFQLENRTGLDPLHEERRRSIKLALLSAQRCMIALGDIARYKEQANETNTYGKARSWYMKAQHLAPRNGRPYNQLAILALYTRRKLDAVYFYVRSLAATNPFLTARESLMTLFEEVRRKVAHKEQEEIEARREMERRREQRRKRRRPSQDENRGRKEVWIAHDGKVEGGERTEEEEDDEIEKGENLSHLSAAELNKKFVLSFLNVHGKLFTKTGMEAFGHARDHLLREFKALLDHSPSAILSTRLIQLMAINMFAVANISPSGDIPPTAEGCPPLLQQAILLGLHMFALLCLRCCSLLQDHLQEQSGDQSVLSQDLHELLPGVKVYADWMMCHPKLWNPPPSSDTTSYSASLDVWSSVAQFLNLVKRVPVPDVKFAVNGEEDSLEVLLPEDMALSGFVPLMALPLQPVFIQADTSKILANDRVRLDSLTMFGEYLSGQETPLISFSVKTDSYVSVAPKAPPPRETDQSYRQEDHEIGGYDNDDVIVMDSYTEDEPPHGDGTISRLRERRDSLEKQLRDRELRESHIQAIVESHRSQRLLEIVIKPYYLIPDTNCFIDHLPAIQRLVLCQRYLMVVPLVVINELDGLARGSREGQYSDPHHAVKVQHGARYAVEYLEEEFANRNRYLCALTSKGSILDSIRFRSEDADWRGNNDDHILRCCMHYCSDDPRQYMPADKDAPLQIKREVVLLTDDRNLRVKAIQQNVPVRDIIMFIRWAKV